MPSKEFDFINRNVLPSRKDEDWKYYDFSDFQENTKFLQECLGDDGLNQSELVKIVDKYVFRECVNSLIVTVNGAYREDLSNFKDTDLIISSLESEKKNEDASFFKRLNDQFIENAFFIKTKPDTEHKETVQVLHISNQNRFNQIRSVIQVEKNSSLNVVVSYVGLEDSKYISNAFIDCYLSKNSKLNFNKIQDDSCNAVTLYHLNANLKRDADFKFNSFHLGANSSRDDITVNLEEPNSNADLAGLYVVNKERKTYQKISVFHKAEHTTSSQVFKGIISDSARAEFNGMIDVAKAAQQTDAKQLNKNLLLSEKAHVDSRPQLNILADDVKCAHGSTIGQLSEEELFYLQSRGLSKEDAFTTLTYSFCEEVLEKITLDSVKNYATNIAFNNMDSKNTSTLSNLADNNKYKKSRYTEK